MVLTSQKISNSNGQIIEGPLLIKPNVFNDERGSFFESWNESTFNSLIRDDIIFFQDNHSTSKIGVLRGLHYQIPPIPQGKLVRCISGEIFDVAVDIRKESPFYGNWISVKLSFANNNLLWIPPGFAHGFLVLLSLIHI